MNSNLDAAIFDMEKVDALMYAIDQTFIEDAGDRHQYLHYALWDAVKQVKDDLARLAEDARVVDAIYAVNDVRRSTLTTEQ